MNWLVLSVIVLVACVTKSSSAEGLRISFTNVTASDDGTYVFINVCEVGTSFSVVCEILVTRSSTNTTMEMTTSDSKIIGTQTGNRSTSDDGNYFRYEFEVTPEYGGNITMTCLASNVLDPAENESSVEENVIIQKASNYGPTIRVTMPGIVNKPYWGTESLEANDGDQLKLDCTSPLYNYPGFSSITIRCDLTNENVTASDETNAVLTIELDLHDVKCYCEAEHVTGCYDKISELTIKSVWGPHIIEFVHNPPEPQNQSMPCWEPNMFMCEALGYPFKTLTVTNERTGIAVPGKCTYVRVDFPETRIFFYKKLDGYDDMGNYVCTADNGRGQVEEEKIFVNVESKPLLFSPSNDGTVDTFYAKNGTVWETRIPILSHPDPTNYTVSHPEDNQVVTDDGYNITYLPTTPRPNGTVVLSLLVSVREGREAEQFVLTIDNGLGTVDYGFEIAIPKEEVADSDSGGLSDGEKAGIGIGVALIVIILIVVAVIAFKKRQKPGRYDTNTTATFTNSHGH